MGGHWGVPRDVGGQRGMGEHWGVRRGVGDPGVLPGLWRDTGMSPGVWGAPMGEGDTGVTPWEP